MRKAKAKPIALRSQEVPVRALAIGARTRKPAHQVALVHADLVIEPPTGGLKDLSLAELEAADRGLRALPERLEKMSGIAAVLNGLVLTEIKSRCKHKEWTPWLKANYGKSARDAQFRMQLAAAFCKNETRFVFEPQQLTLAFLDGSSLQQVDANHPVVMAVEKWTDGRGYRQLIADETSDGRSDNPGGFRPNATILRGWLKETYPDQPEYLENCDCFTALPKEVQERFKKEGERYEKRLTKDERTELEREEEAHDWWGRGPKLLSTALDHGLDDFASTEQLQQLHELLGDFRTQVRRKLDTRAKGGAAQKPKALPAKA
jgi:hypothetical protein